MGRAWSTVIVAAVVVGAVAVSASNQSSAQNAGAAGGLNVACVNVGQVFNEYQRQKDLAEEIKQERDRLSLELEQRRMRIDGARSVLDALDPQDPTYQAKMRDLLEMNIRFKNWMDLNDAAVGREIGVWTATIYRELLKATADIARERGYSLVLYRDEFELLSTDPAAVQELIRARKVLYADDRVDITQAVLDKLNAEYRAQPRQKMIQLLTGTP